MDISSFLESLEKLGIATRMRESLYLFPMLESMHVLALALVFGTIVVLDLRMLGKASSERPFGRVASDILKWTWIAFAISAVTGSLMFITNARVYYHNFYFRSKMLLLVLAGLNMAVFELTTGREAAQWEKEPAAPPRGRVAAALSIAIWIVVIFMGRMVGFTTTRSTAAPPPPAVGGVNFDDFLNAAPPGAPPASAPPAPAKK